MTGSYARIVATLALVVLVLAGCATRRTSAPVDDRRPAPAAAPPPPVAQPAPALPASAAAPGHYVVKRGDTLYSIALEHGVDYRELAQWNSLDDASKISIGQTLRVTSPEDRAVQIGAARGAGQVESRPIDRGTQPAAAVPGEATKTGPKALRLPYSSENLAMLQKGEAPAGAAKPAAKPEPIARAEPRPEPEKLTRISPPRDPEIVELVWPAKGNVIVEFSEPRVKGVDIAGNLGDPIIAAAPGKVIYAGADIPGMGKFLVIKHDNEVTTVYAHAKELLVRKDQLVVRGQKVAELGNSDADRPKLHFQLRKLGRPLDPIKYLPPL